MEKFLEFWSHYNALIIEVAVALILVSVIFLAYRTFFGSKGVDASETGSAGHASIDTSHIEKTLQKILEQQASTKASPGATAERPKGSAGPASAPASAELIHEVASLKKALEEKEKHIVILKEQVEIVSKAEGAGAAAAVAAPAASTTSGLSDGDRQDYEAKIKELEARLAEYEIISEDIADVSFFKEENARLNAELEALKAGGTIAAAPVDTVPAAEPPLAAAPPEPVVETPEATPEATPAPAEPDAALLAELAAQDPAGEPAAAAPAASDEAANAIDDSLMAEFARAVEGQKEGTLENPPKSAEDSKLLEEFENFSKKG